MKKYTYLLVIFIVGIMATQSVAQDYRTSVGARLGTYFAGSYKTFISEKSALEGVAGISRVGGQSLLSLGAYYQRHHTFTSDIPTLKWYYGGGLFTALGNSDIDTNMSITAAIGLEYTFEDTPINIFIDALPYYSLTNSNGIETEASLGVRYILNRE